MPKANLRQLPGPIFQEFECSVCKARISKKYTGTLNDEQKAREQETAIFKLWDEHLYTAHRRQWDAEQAKNAKRQARQIKKRS